MGRPLIGISANLFPPAPRASYPGKALVLADRAMVDRVFAVGGLPIVLPITTEVDALGELADLVDGLLLTGGADVDPSSYGQSPRGWTGQPERDACELMLVERVRRRRRPVLGVCRGNQVLNVAFGGTLLHDIATDRPESRAHRDNAVYDQHRHRIRLAEGSLLSELHGGSLEVDTNSVHHQAIDRLGSGLRATAWADDGLVEAIVAPQDAWTHGVQWHPEWDAGPAHTALFRRFVEAAS